MGGAGVPGAGRGADVLLHQLPHRRHRRRDLAGHPLRRLPAHSGEEVRLHLRIALTDEHSVRAIRKWDLFMKQLIDADELNVGLRRRSIVDQLLIETAERKQQVCSLADTGSRSTVSQ